MQEYKITLKVETEEIYSVMASSEEEALEKFEAGEGEEVSIHENAFAIDDPKVSLWDWD